MYREFNSQKRPSYPWMSRTDSYICEGKQEEFEKLDLDKIKKMPSDDIFQIKQKQLCDFLETYSYRIPIESLNLIDLKKVPLNLRVSFFCQDEIFHELSTRTKEQLSYERKIF